MDEILSFIQRLLLYEIGLILALFLYELNLFRFFLIKLDRFYLEIVTHPKQKVIYHIFGDILYMVGGSVTGAGVYEYFANNNMLTLVIIVGIISIISGATIRENNKKGK